MKGGVNQSNRRKIMASRYGQRRIKAKVRAIQDNPLGINPETAFLIKEGHKTKSNRKDKPYIRKDCKIRVR